MSCGQGDPHYVPLSTANVKDHKNLIAFLTTFGKITSYPHTIWVLPPWSQVASAGF